MRSYFENAVFIRGELRRLDGERAHLPGEFSEEAQEEKKGRERFVFAYTTLQKLLFDCERNRREKPGAPQRDAELLYRILTAFFNER
jgi:hypothetical protein